MRILGLVLLGWLSLQAAEIKPQAGDYVRLEVAKTGLLRGKVHVFEFPEYGGSLNEARDAFEIRLASGKIVVKDDWVKPADLKKILEFTLKDVLAAKEHPEIVYRSTEVVKNGKEATAKGNLTIRGIVRTAVVKLKEVGEGVYEGKSEVDMREFKLKPPSAMFGTIGTEPLMKLKFRLSVR
ncbi:MAG: hypothetical protein OHK0021_13900 [Bryobacter sp.]